MTFIRHQRQNYHQACCSNCHPQLRHKCVHCVVVLWTPGFGFGVRDVHVAILPGDSCIKSEVLPQEVAALTGFLVLAERDQMPLKSGGEKHCLRQLFRLRCPPAT